MSVDLPVPQMGGCYVRNDATGELVPTITPETLPTELPVMEPEPVPTPEGDKPETLAEEN
jgi:hypothetical protein